MASLKSPITSKDHFQGERDAVVVLVEYGDYECPHCGLAYPIVKRVQQHFGAQLGFVFRNFPLNEVHPNAEYAAEAAEFAGAHDRFWEMHDGIFENQENLDVSLLIALAESLGLSAPALRKALSEREYLPRVREDFLGGVRSGVNGTPTFFIDGQRHDGPFEFEDLVAAIEAKFAAKSSAR
jgi:protein-disulfide isomerase